MTEAQFFEYLLYRYEGEFCLKIIGPVETVEAVGSEDSLGFREDLVLFGIIQVKSKVRFHLANLIDLAIDFLEAASRSNSMKIAI